MPPIIAADNLTKRYGRRTGVDRVRLAVPEGAIFGFLGPNGAGKTTLIRVLLGFLRPTEGNARVFGLDCWAHNRTIKQDVGYLPGDLRLYSWMNGNSALAISGGIRGRDLTADGGDLADRFRLDLAVRVRKMSRGMRQKLGLILALAHEPRLLILDEPTSGLDPLMRDELAACLRERAAAGSTVFFSSHTLSEVEALCNRVAIVRDGSIVADEDLDVLRRRARRTVILRFVDAQIAASTTPPSFLEIEERRGDAWHCELRDGADSTTPQLLQWAAAQPLRDIEIRPPDLESVFRRFYRVENESAVEDDES